MTVIKRGCVPNTIKEAVQEKFTCMGGGYSVSIKWSKSENVSSFRIFRELSSEPEPIIYTFVVSGDEIHYTSCDVNTCEAAQKVLPNSEDAFFNFCFSVIYH